jgi:hypothetical protein
MIREHTFVRTRGCIYRVFGHLHPADHVYLLLRYFREGDAWIKPDVYASEAFEHPWLRRYDLPTAAVAEYGIRLAVGSRDPVSYLETYDPTASRDLCLLDALQIKKVPFGLTGSRLVGLERPTSDVDVLLYGDLGTEAAREVLAECSQRDRPIAPSVTFQRLWDLAGGAVPRAVDRNIYTGRHPHLGDKKLEMMFCETSDGAITDASLSVSSKTPRMEVCAFTVEDSSQRQYFPGRLACTSGSGHSTQVFILDHVLGYLLPGDRIEVTGYEVDGPLGRAFLAAKLTWADLC